MRTLGGLLALVSIVACSRADEEPFAEYPAPPGGEVDREGVSPAPSTSATPTPTPPPAPEPIVGQTLWTEPTWVEGATTDGHLVATRDRDLVALPAGATQPELLLKDYDSSADEVVVRGRLVSMWLGEDVFPSPVRTWTKTGGLVPSGPVSMRGVLYAKPSSETFAYRGKATSSLRSTVAVVAPGQAQPVTILTSLDNGVVETGCRPAFGWAGNDLVIGGCVDGATSWRVARHATDGSGAKATILDNAVPGMWLNRARTKIVVQSQAGSSIRSLTGVGANVDLDTTLRAALHSDDDSKVVYVRSDGKLRSAATTAPVSPIDLGTGALSLLGISGDARFAVFATKTDDATSRTDIVVADAQAPASPPRMLAAEKAIFHGLTTDGSAAVYQTTSDVTASGPLFVAPLAGGAPVQVSAVAERVVFDGGVVYFQQFDKATRTMSLHAARVKAPASPFVVEPSVDVLTSSVTLAGGRMFVASKLGLVAYPAVKP